ncbi:AlpA family transcriptional regulator [Hydrogenophaga sp.]|uniref:helix-turn-helix transcriptional regulator n=1 Tax=Hydrogenophaga sp. TaxID=1904254 RepID=UPI002CAE9137|nr:AlpA family transcriptional regulator [Hydrogenophaga sp.]HMP11180.1 AlpA family transcriptional regulator [Hydrogenophaga sp.]
METKEFFLRLPQVKGRTGASKSLIYQLIREGKFPRPVKIGTRAVAWTESSIDQWQAERQSAD